MNKINSWEKELDQLRAIISETGLTETTKWGGPVFTIDNINVVGISGFKHHFALWFFKGALLSDPENKLMNAQESTKLMRQWRFTSVDQIDKNLILKYVQEAIVIATSENK